MVLSTLGRMIWVPIAFLLAIAAAGFMLVSLSAERITQAIHGRGNEADSIAAMLELLRQAHLLISGLTLVPAVLLVIIGEVARIRSALYYIIGGGAAFAAVPLLAKLGQVGSIGAAVPPTLVWQVFATAGFVGGWIYWLLAGRRA